MTPLWQAPLVFVSFMAWLLSPPTGLADAAAHEAVRRQLTAKSAHAYTNADLPQAAIAAPIASADDPDAADDASPPNPPVPPGAPAPAADHDETWWRDQMATARAAVDHDEVMLEALQSRINALTADVASRDDPAQRAVLQDELQKAETELDRLEKQQLADRETVDQLEETARRTDVPPGWVR